jgi:hypothetical protein
MTPEDFLQVMREQRVAHFQQQQQLPPSQPITAQVQPVPQPQTLPPIAATPQVPFMQPPQQAYGNPSSFEAGKMFSIYDRDQDGKLDKKEFEELMRAHPEMLTRPMAPFRSAFGDNSQHLPVELVTGRLITHYDETACVGITTAAVEQHKAMGNVVYPLIESYKNRYDRLRTLLTTRLFPRRFVMCCLMMF